MRGSMFNEKEIGDPWSVLSTVIERVSFTCAAKGKFGQLDGMKNSSFGRNLL